MEMGALQATSNARSSHPNLYSAIMKAFQQVCCPHTIILVNKIIVKED